MCGTYGEKGVINPFNPEGEDLIGLNKELFDKIYKYLLDRYRKDELNYQNANSFMRQYLGFTMKKDPSLVSEDDMLTFYVSKNETGILRRRDIFENYVLSGFEYYLKEKAK